MATSFRIESSVRGHHVYKSIDNIYLRIYIIYDKSRWTPVIGEELCVQVEDNTFDEFAVAVWKDGIIVPRELAITCWYFLKKRHSTMTCRVTEHRRLSEVQGKGLVVPCMYIFNGKMKYVDKLIALFVDN